ncbi:MAG: ABC transporter substrate-binding protein [Gemmatimonadales bacterium]
MRVVTLLPAATEIVMALGGADALVGVSHECDFPPAVARLPRLTASPIDPAASSGAIDSEVRRLRAEGLPVIAVDAAALARLAPDLLITQGLCEVCAVVDGQIHRLASVLHPAPAVLSLSARTLPGIWDDIRSVGRALDLADDADELVAGLRTRLRRLGTNTPSPAPRVVCVEWLDPPYLAGHWVPELVAAAGGLDVGASAGDHSAVRRWSEVLELRADLIIVTLCGFDVRRAREELAGLDNSDAGRLFSSARLWILDGNAYTSRPGPRVVDGAERLQSAMRGKEMPGLERWT